MTVQHIYLCLVLIDIAHQALLQLTIAVAFQVLTYRYMELFRHNYTRMYAMFHLWEYQVQILLVHI